MADGLRRGGPNLYSLADASLPLPADRLHQMADRTYGTGAFAQAWQKDSDDSDAWVKKAEDTDLSWVKTVSGLDDYPGSPKAGRIFEKTGMLPWLYQSYFKSVDLMSPFYDPSPQADDKTKETALAIGDPLYTSGGTSQEQEAWKLWKKNSGDVVPNEILVPRVFADDARIFLASGGFPRTAPAPDTPEFRIAVEDLKSRFASCAWHDPIDPDRVLGKEVAQASAEWQQEISSQATQRNQILAASSTGNKALRDGSFALGKLLGQSWIADYSTRWLDYYTEGGLGWIGDGQLEIQVPGAAGKCLDVARGGKTNGTPVQVYTCNGGAAQKWQLMGSYDGGYTLVNPNSFKCLEVQNGNSADGTKIQIRDCGSAKAQQWKFDVRSAGPLVNAASGKCLHLPTFDNSKDAVLSTCNGSVAQKFRIVPKTHTGTAPAKADVEKAKANITAAQAEAKKQLAVVKTQLETAQKAATASDTALQAAYGIALTINVGKARITATQHHPFRSPSAHRWNDAGDLKAGQTLRTSNGETVTVVRVHRDHQLHPAYNLTVDSLHTYYVPAGTTAVLVHNSGVCLFPNTMPGTLAQELALAENLGVKPAAVGSAAFDAAITSGTSKWAVREDGSLVIIPKFVQGKEISHSVLTGGAPVRAAGEADIAGSAKDGYFGLDINNHSGHFLPSSESLKIGKEAFTAAGVHF
ncbi:RICIN domain-containing protein [Streptomyces sp. NPDC004012]